LVLAFPKSVSVVSILPPNYKAFVLFPSLQIMSQRLLQLVEQSSMKEKVDPFGIGDTVDVHTKIQEGAKERIQVFSGTVIAKSGAGTREMFVVRRIVGGEGVERKFPVHSPRIDKIDVKRRSVVRRAKLYFLRGRIGKSVRLTERRV
jgi:large subunit ribosomal protein L19